MTVGARITFHASGRVNSNAFAYFQLCASSLVKYRGLIPDTSGRLIPDPKRTSFQDEQEQNGVQAVVFGSMCLEAMLFDFSACNFGEKFAVHLDKLDPVGKFFVLSQFINGREPDTGSVTYQSVQRLINARNKLVHHKSLTYTGSALGDITRHILNEHEKHVQAVEESFNTLVLFSLHFPPEIFEALRILPSFRNTEDWAPAVPTELKQDVYRCIELSCKENAKRQKKSEK